jgi:hypothetical protein
MNSQADLSLCCTKWLREPLEVLPAGGALHERLPCVLEISDFCGEGISAKAELLEALVCEHLSGAERSPDPGPAPARPACEA